MNIHLPTRIEYLHNHAMALGPEKLIEKAIMLLLTLRGFVVLKINTTGMYDPKKRCFRKLNSPYTRRGVSDILAFKAPLGRLLALEVKTPETRNRVSEDQKAFLKDVNDAGGIGRVVVCLADVEVALNDYFALGVCKSCNTIIPL